MATTRPPRGTGHSNEDEVVKNVEELKRQLRAALLKKGEHWLSIAQTAYELDLTERYVRKLIRLGLLASTTDENGDALVCGHHVMEQRAWRALKRLEAAQRRRLPRKRRSSPSPPQAQFGSTPPSARRTGPKSATAARRTARRRGGGELR